MGLKKEVQILLLKIPFKAFSAATVGLWVHTKNLNAKPIIVITEAICINCILS